VVAAGGADQSAGDVDEPGADGGSGRHGELQRGQGAQGAGEVVRDRGQRQPAGVGGERPGRGVRQRPCLQVGDDLLDDGVVAVLAAAV